MPEGHPIVVFQAIGQDPRVSNLDSLTNTPLYNKKQQLRDNDGIADFIELAAVTEAKDEDSAVEIVQAWIETHLTLLDDLDAEITLEFQTTIMPEQGSNALVLPASFVELLASIDARLIHQYIRVLSEAELEQLRREGRGPASDSPT